MKDVNEFVSHDFYCCACVLASGLRLKRLEKSEDRFINFVFDDPECLAEEIIERHWNRELKIPTRQLIEAINELKTRLHTGR